MDAEKNKSTHGGKREGAGRPKTNAKMFTFRADAQLARFIDGQDNKSQFILNCIKNTLVAYPASRLKDLRLPYVETEVAAGFPIPLDGNPPQDIELLRLLCPNPESTYLIRVQGDSMIDADIRSGDILVVDKSNRNPSPKQPALCELNGEYTIKYVVSREGRGRLVPANSEYPEIEISPGDDFSIWGTVTYIIHKPRN